MTRHVTISIIESNKGKGRGSARRSESQTCRNVSKPVENMSSVMKTRTPDFLERQCYEKCYVTDLEHNIEGKRKKNMNE